MTATQPRVRPSQVAERYGRVIMITNSAPGWLETSCSEFLPALLPKMRTLQWFAKPMSYLLTFKLEVFKREFGNKYANLVSIGDGVSERTATLRLVNQQPAGQARHCKSCKRQRGLPPASPRRRRTRPPRVRRRPLRRCTGRKRRWC